MNIQRLSPENTIQLLPKLAVLLQDAVASGASIGFLPPLTHEDAVNYWLDVVSALKTPYRILLTAEMNLKILGAVQLDMASRPNGSHRAEISKLMVHTSQRGQGIGRALMNAIEAEAKLAGRTTLILDTREGDPSERLYSRLGYTRAGTIPEYAHSADGSLHTTVFMYKLLK
ncbi:MAG: GNAT family N-acetyltransferase [Chloroflexi bacterium]|nr:GNAT family N-acetyltransferase [Chloroflexota bacterium]